MFGWLDPSMHNYDFHALMGHFPMFWDALLHPGIPLAMSVLAIGLGIALGFSQMLRTQYNDWADNLYPGFYTGVSMTPAFRPVTWVGTSMPCRCRWLACSVGRWQARVQTCFGRA